jgi:hypothetical protein
VTLGDSWPQNETAVERFKTTRGAPRPTVVPCDSTEHFSLCPATSGVSCHVEEVIDGGL